MKHQRRINEGKTCVLTVFRTGLDKHLIIRGISSASTMVATFFGSGQGEKRAFGLMISNCSYGNNKKQFGIRVYTYIPGFLPAQALHIPPIPNSTSFSFGSVIQSMNSSKTFSCSSTPLSFHHYKDAVGDIWVLHGKL